MSEALAPMTDMFFVTWGRLGPMVEAHGDSFDGAVDYAINRYRDNPDFPELKSLSRPDFLVARLADDGIWYKEDGFPHRGSAIEGW